LLANNYIFAYYNYRRNNHGNQYARMSQVHVAKPTDHLISVSSGPWTLLLKLGPFFPSKMQQT